MGLNRYTHLCEWPRIPLRHGPAAPAMHSSGSLTVSAEVAASRQCTTQPRAALRSVAQSSAAGPVGAAWERGRGGSGHGGAAVWGGGRGGFGGVGMWRFWRCGGCVWSGAGQVASGRGSGARRGRVWLCTKGTRPSYMPDACALLYGGLTRLPN